MPWAWALSQRMLTSAPWERRRGSIHSSDARITEAPGVQGPPPEVGCQRPRAGGPRWEAHDSHCGVPCPSSCALLIQLLRGTRNAGGVSPLGVAAPERRPNRSRHVSTQGLDTWWRAVLSRRLIQEARLPGSGDSLQTGTPGPRGAARGSYGSQNPDCLRPISALSGKTMPLCNYT